MILLAFVAVAFALRLIPALFIQNNGFLYTDDTDGWYTLRQIEVMVHHFPQYNWFDPMTAYPSGKFIDWGPLYPFIAACLCLITGAASQTAVVSTAGWVSPLMAMVLVPVVYCIGKLVRDWQTGIIAAGLVAVISYHYFFLSSYGVIGHHIAEVLTTSIFVLIYLLSVRHFRTQETGGKTRFREVFPILLAILAGFCWFCALLSSPTVILLLVVIGVYTLVQFVIDHWNGRLSLDLLIVNGIFLSLSSALMVLYGFHATGLSIIRYSPGLVFINLVLLAETAVLFCLSFAFHGKKTPYLLSLVVLVGAGMWILLFYPPVMEIGHQASTLLFGSVQFSVGVVETNSLTLPVAWDFFGLSIFLTAGGLVVLGYSLAKKPQSAGIFLLIWSLVMLLLTIKFMRFDYYSTVNIALLSAICIIEPFRWQDDTLREKFSAAVSRIAPPDPTLPGQEDTHKEENTTRDSPKKKKKSPSPQKNRNITETLRFPCLILILLITGVLVGNSVIKDVYLGLITPDRELSPDWIESLGWLENNTPDTGVDYFGTYPSSGYTYPNGSYGIMTSWDSGHWITFFAHRIPITSPFQDNLGGSNGAAAYFLMQNESQADAILSDYGGRYVIVDSDLAVDTFTNLGVWESGTTNVSPWLTWFMLPEQSNSKVLDKVYRFNNGYFQTQAARLYDFDGSLTTPTNAEYITYTIHHVPEAGESAGEINGYARVISNDSPVNISAGTGNLTLIPEGSKLSTSDYAGLYSDIPYEPVETVPALKHYRLIHESPDNATVSPFPESDISTLPGIKEVKIFGFVKGAQIAGSGTITVPVVTNTGRTFVYRQESENGMFTVPYTTIGSPYEVRATGPYHILGTDRFINVTEDDVVEGNTVV
jgi:dolichyl-diphosphooligosaccharide--protein glycosyltransferase